jgi:chromosome segregation ATPase
MEEAMTIDESELKRLEELASNALEVSEPEWRYIDGPLMGDVCVQTRPLNPGRSQVRVDPNSLGPYIAALAPATVKALITAIREARQQQLDERAIAQEWEERCAERDAEVATWRQRAMALLVATDASEVDSLRAQLAESQAEVARLRQAVEHYHKQTIVLGAMHNRVLAQRDEALDMLAKVTEERDALQVENARLRSDIGLVNAQRDQANTNHRSALRHWDEAAAERDSFRRQRDEAQSCAKESAEMYRRCQAQRDEAQAEVARLQHHNDSLVDIRDALRTRCESLGDQRDEALEILTRMTDERDLERELANAVDAARKETP